MAEGAARESNWHQATRDVQLVTRTRELLIEYEQLHGGPPPLAWLLAQLDLPS